MVADPDYDVVLFDLSGLVMGCPTRTYDCDSFTLEELIPLRAITLERQATEEQDMEEVAKSFRVSPQGMFFCQHIQF